MSKKSKIKSAKVKNSGARRRAESVKLKTPDILAEQKEKFQEFFPHVFTEGKIDVEKLRAALGDAADERPERYSFTWAGKRAAMLELQKPAWGTLVPAKNESVNFDTTQNVFIEGENLEVLKLLYKSYFGRVKMIYIDPPYNTGSDFVYPDNFADPKDSYLRITGQKDAEGNLLTSNPESSGRYHSAWLFEAFRGA
jgi:adenine-specific DNA-methyltransferase